MWGNGVEKRMYPRAEVAFPVEIAHTKIFGESANVSRTGLRLAISEPIQLTRSQLTINFSTEEFVRLPFQVAWKRGITDNGKYDYGVSFLDVGDEEVRQLQKVVIKNEIGKTVKGVLNNDTRESVSNFFTEDLAAFVTTLDNLQRSPILWISEEQNKLDAYSHALVAKGDQLVEKIGNRRIIKEIKCKFREMVGPFPYKSTLMSQGLNKPYGYPGDFNLIEEIYDDRPLSEDKAKYFDFFFLNNPYAQAVRSRKEKMKGILKEFIMLENFPTVNVLNLGCGPCREIRELFITDGFKTDKEVYFILLDQDEKALKYAKSLLEGMDKNVQCSFIKEDVFSFFRSPVAESLIEKQQLIYTIGLADYLPDRILKKTVQGCFSLLAKGGTFILAHKDKARCPQALISPDWFCDWRFVARDEEYLVNLIEEAELKDLSIKREVESTGKIVFLYLKKTA